MSSDIYCLCDLLFCQLLSVKVRECIYVDIENPLLLLLLLSLLLWLLYTKGALEMLRARRGNQEYDYIIDRRYSLKLQ